MNENIPFIVVVRPIECELEILVLVRHVCTAVGNRSMQYLVLYIKQLRESHAWVLRVGSRCGPSLDVELALLRLCPRMRVLRRGNSRPIPPPRTLYTSRPFKSSQSKEPISVDEFGVPISSSWSVRQLLRDYPAPTLSDAAFEKLHKLSALNAPSDPTERESLRRQLEGLIKMVNAVRIAPLPDGGEDGKIEDARIWPEDYGIDLERKVQPPGEGEPHGRELLVHSKVSNEEGVYILPDIKKKLV